MAAREVHDQRAMVREQPIGHDEPARPVAPRSSRQVPLWSLS